MTFRKVINFLHTAVIFRPKSYLHKRHNAMKISDLVMKILNPFSAMGNFRHPIIVSYISFETEIINLKFDILSEMQYWVNN